METKITTHVNSAKMDKKQNQKKKTPKKEIVPKTLPFHNEKVQRTVTLMKEYLTKNKFQSGNQLKKGAKVTDEHFIPFVREVWSKGTQVPVIRVYYLGSPVTSTGGGDINTVIDIKGNNFTGMTELCQVFDEFRPIRGILRFTPQVNVSLRNTSGIDYKAVAVGYIDYVNGNPVGSLVDALAHDTSKQFHTCHEESWSFEFDFAPDQSWLDSSTDLATDLGYLKLYSDVNLGAAATEVYGHIWGHCDFQFRLA